MARTLDYEAATCAFSATGNCGPLEPTLEDIQIVEAGCGDDCVATIKTDGSVGVDVISSAAGDVLLSVRARADGSAEFTDRFPVRYSTHGIRVDHREWQPDRSRVCDRSRGSRVAELVRHRRFERVPRGTFEPKIMPSDPFMDVQLCPHRRSARRFARTSPTMRCWDPSSAWGEAVAWRRHVRHCRLRGTRTAHGSRRKRIVAIALAPVAVTATAL